ncbi:NAD-dependent epimerase/dehydratase family protein [Vibrio lentus]|uniref:NAD-dependent epimerase/dehydratase domain-containing protein n=2 Tax=Vibrio lentus TaxID=136468 RepID=A0AB36XLP7_9VIBR|nr:NAD(P)-dependent oxidoreductase [Vibrio lentus]MCC4837788.1 NAD(P)-dependent oxidoreductase [Vibrio lentus]PMI15667.1 hypothetical protein BCU51_17040 [Vibrio lentus]PMK31420.1 hypothetical protein BCU02_02065 [Vibrio lentus]PMK46312.1 hypothetical protein BCT99_20225 [Vibrio lentus]PML34064.1 hypothetical protein BCT79_10750 [Vibrio lentus]
MKNESSSHFNYMRVLIFGGTGYIGTMLSRFLVNQNYVVGNVSRTESKINGVVNYSISSDIYSTLDSFKPEKIIYLSACFDNSNIDEILNVNIKIPLKILNSIESIDGIEFIYTGSYWQFGDRSKPDIPIDLYSTSKKAMSNFLEYYNEYTNVRCKDIVLYGSYGESDTRGKLLDYLLSSTINNEKVNLTKGEQSLNLVSVTDICLVLKDIIDGKYECNKLQLMSSRNYTPKDLVALISQYAPIDVVFGTVPYRKVELMEPNMTNGYETVMVEDKIQTYISNALNFKSVK